MTTRTSSRLTLLLAILLVCGAIQPESALAQSPCNPQLNRYKLPIFPLVSRVNDVTYARADNYLGIPQDLKLDVYMPANDTLRARPVVFMFFGGGFVLGEKTDADMTAWCDSLASLGYVAVSVQYRLGLNTTDANSATRAAYRALQDSRAAIRYIKEFHATYRVDTNYIFVGGESAGSITAIHTAYLDQESERPQASYRYLLEPDLGCLDCSGNTYAHTVNVKGVLNIWGAILDTNLIAANDPPMVTIHGTDDAVVPFDEGVPFTVGYTFPRLQGALPLNARLTNLGIYHEFYPYQGLGHVFYGIPAVTVTFPNQYWPPVYAQGRDFFHALLQFATGAIVSSGPALQNQQVSYSVPAQAGSKYCWEVTGGSIVGPATGASITVQWGSGPSGTVRATEVNSIDVVGASASLPVQIGNPASVSPDASAPVWLLAPNPANSLTGTTLRGNWASNVAVEVLDALGRSVYQTTIATGMSEHQLPTQNWPAGVYSVQVSGAFGSQTQKLICH